MVQRKAPDKPKSQIEQKKSHGRQERQFSSHLQQDTGTRGRADLKKRLEKVKSMKVSDFNGRNTSSFPIRNYMKPTSSSDARKEKLRVTVDFPVTNDKKKKSPRSSKKSNSAYAGSSSSSSPRAGKTLSRQSSLKAVKSSMKKSLVADLCAKKNVNRATCSSTLKDSKFPSALELNHGANESEGASKMRVCPYTYCSLNGHMHEPLPPLKCFISARRKLLKTQRSFKVKGLLSFRTSMIGKKGERIDDELEDEIRKNPSDLFVEIYTMPQEEIVGENKCDEISILEENYDEQCMLDEAEYSMETMSQFNESSDVSFDQNSEFSQEEMDHVMMNFLEYVEFDHERTTAQKEYDEDGEISKSEIKTTDMTWEEEICLFPENIEIFECSDEQFLFNGTSSYASFEEGEDDSESEEGNFQSINYDVQKLPAKTMNCQSDERSLGDESKCPEKELQEASNGTVGNILNVSATDYKEINGGLSSRWNITKRRTSENFDQVKEFNPRPPNFLPLEPDPEAEKVDLRHQTMDERRNSEEWMIDYALQKAVTRLGPARKKKVALLVEAFETVSPMPMCEKPLSHGTSTFNHLSFIQACN